MSSETYSSVTAKCPSEIVSCLRGRKNRSVTNNNYRCVRKYLICVKRSFGIQLRAVVVTFYAGIAVVAHYYQNKDKASTSSLQTEVTKSAPFGSS